MKTFRYLLIVLLIIPGFMYAQNGNDQFYIIDNFANRQLNQAMAGNANYPGLLPGIGNNNIGIISAFSFPSSFGFTSFYSHRIGYDTYATGELGFFLNSNYNPVENSYNPDAENPVSAYVIPVYFGVKKYLKHRTQILPYFSAGAGIALGIGTVFYHSKTSFDKPGLTPTVYVGFGANIAITKRMAVNFELRPRFLRFSKEIGEWKDFSGISLLIGFGYAGF